MTPYTHTDATGADIKVHTNDVYTLVQVNGNEAMLSPDATGALMLCVAQNSLLSKEWKQKIKDAL